MRYIYKKAETLDGDMALVQMILPTDAKVYIDLGVNNEAYRTDKVLVTNIWTYEGAELGIAASLWDSDPIYIKNEITHIKDTNIDKWGGIHFTLTPESTQNIFVITGNDQYAPISNSLKDILSTYKNTDESDQISDLYGKMDTIMNEHIQEMIDSCLNDIDVSKDDSTREYYSTKLQHIMYDYKPTRIQKFHMFQEIEAKRVGYDLHPELSLIKGLDNLSKNQTSYTSNI